MRPYSDRCDRANRRTLDEVTWAVRLKRQRRGTGTEMLVQQQRGIYTLTSRRNVTPGHRPRHRRCRPTSSSRRPPMPSPDRRGPQDLPDLRPAQRPQHIGPSAPLKWRRPQPQICWIAAVCSGLHAEPATVDEHLVYLPLGSGTKTARCAAADTHPHAVAGAVMVEDASGAGRREGPRPLLGPPGATASLCHPAQNKHLRDAAQRRQRGFGGADASSGCRSDTRWPGSQEGSL